MWYDDDDDVMIMTVFCRYNVGSGHDTIPQTLDISAKYTNTGSLDTQASIQEKISISG